MAAGISAGTAFIDILPNMRGFAAAVAKSGTLLSAQRAFKEAGRTVTHHFTLPVLAAAGASVKLAVDFDESMDKIVGLVGIGRKEVDKMGESILELAPKVHQGPKELADALFFITSAGFRGAKAMDVLEASAKGATSGLGEVKTVADAVTSAVNAYGEGSLSASRAADILSNTVKSGKVEATAIAPVLGSLLPLSQRLGVGFDQVGASLASMTRIGESAPRAATALRGFYTSLLNITPKVTKALKDVGLSQKDLLADLRDPNKGLPVVLQKLQRAFGDNILKIRQAFPNIRGLSGLLELTGKNTKTTLSIFEDMRHSMGQNNRAFKAVTEDAGQKFHAFLVDLEVAAIRLGNVLIPLLANIVDHLTSWLEAFQKLNPTLRKWIGIGILAVAALGPLLTIIGNLILAIRLLGFAIEFMLGPIGLTILAIAALVAGFILLYKHSETFRTIVGAVVDFVKKRWELLLLVFFPVIGLIVQIIKHFQTLKAIAIGVINAIKTAFKIAVNIMKITFLPFIVLFKLEWLAFEKVVIPIFKHIVDYGRAKLAPFVNFVKTVVGAIVRHWGTIEAIWFAVWDNVKAAGAAAANWVINNVINPIISGINHLIDAINKLPGPDIGHIDNIPNVGGGGGPVYAGPHAEGGKIGLGQWGTVGEMGIEAVRATPTGAMVYPNRSLKNLGRGRMRLHIDNWHEGTGWVEEVSGDLYDANVEHAKTVERMGR